MFTRLIDLFRDWWVNKPVIGDRGLCLRSSKWSGTRKQHILREPRCQWCGGKLDLEVHHVEPFHVNPSRELDDSNLITLCEHGNKDCHLRRGHNGSWKMFNPNIRVECDVRKKRDFPEEDN